MSSRNGHTFTLLPDAPVLQPWTCPLSCRDFREYPAWGPCPIQNEVTAVASFLYKRAALSALLPSLFPVNSNNPHPCLAATPSPATESSWRQEAFLGAKTLQGKVLQNTPICPAWKLAPTSAEKARQSQLGIRGKWGQAGAGARSCKSFHVRQHRSCRPVCSFHLGLLLTRQQNVLKGGIRKIIFIPSILWLG